MLSINIEYISQKYAHENLCKILFVSYKSTFRLLQICEESIKTLILAFNKYEFVTAIDNIIILNIKQIN